MSPDSALGVSQDRNTLLRREPARGSVGSGGSERGSAGEREPVDQLTRSEREILALIAEGRSNRAVAERLRLSARTVENRITAIYAKLEIEADPDDNRRVLAVLAFVRSR